MANTTKGSDKSNKHTHTEASVNNRIPGWEAYGEYKNRVDSPENCNPGANSTALAPTNNAMPTIGVSLVLVGNELSTTGKALASISNVLATTSKELTTTSEALASMRGQLNNVSKGVQHSSLN
jgi:hypothetical protein